MNVFRCAVPINLSDTNSDNFIRTIRPLNRRLLSLQGAKYIRRQIRRSNMVGVGNTKATDQARQELNENRSTVSRYGQKGKELWNKVCPFQSLQFQSVKK